jgi:hypothetical protein
MLTHGPRARCALAGSEAGRGQAPGMTRYPPSGVDDEGCTGVENEAHPPFLIGIDLDDGQKNLWPVRKRRSGQA